MHHMVTLWKENKPHKNSVYFVPRTSEITMCRDLVMLGATASLFAPLLNSSIEEYEKKSNT